MRKCKKNRIKKSRITAFFMAFTLVLTTCFCSMMQTVYAETAGPQPIPRGEDFTELTEDSDRTLTSGFYCVKQDLYLEPEEGSKNGLRIAPDSTVFIYVVSDVTLEVYGRDAEGTEGGGAAIYLQEGATLILLGEGNVIAIGGEAAEGEDGEKGKTSSFSGTTVNMGAGGKGGDGGGGAGAGIGTDGGNGGAGGAGGAGYSISYDEGGNGANGEDGENGTKAEASGEVYITSSLNLTASGGLHKGKGGGGNHGGVASATIEGSLRRAAGGAGGAGGGGGYGGAGIGTGGGGAGGGGGGASSGYTVFNLTIGGGGGGGGAGSQVGTVGTCSSTKIYSNTYASQSKIIVSAKNGSGSNGGVGGKGSYTLDDGTTITGAGGKGGNGGSSGGSMSSKAQQEATIDNYIPYYTATFRGAAEEETQIYYMSYLGIELYVPPYNPGNDQTFLGWQVVQGTKSLVDYGMPIQFEEGDTALYQPGDIIPPEIASYGDIILEPLVRSTSTTTADWKNTTTDTGATLLAEEDCAVQQTSSTNWTLRQQETDSAGQLSRAVLQNSGTVDVTVAMQDGSSLEGITVKCYQIFGIEDMYTDEDTGEMKYVFKLENELYRSFFVNYFSMGDAMATDSAIVNEILKLKDDDEALKTLASNLKYFIKQNEILPIASQTGTETDTQMTLDISREYVYENGQGYYTGGMGYYFVSRDDAIDNTYILHSFPEEHNFIYLKGSGLVVKKTGDKVLMKYGETVTYTVTTKVMNTGADVNYIYNIYDWLDPALQFVDTSVKLCVNQFELTKGTDYTVEIVQEIPEGQTEPQNVIKVSLLWGGTLKNDSHVGQPLVLTYEATVGKDAKSGNGTGNENFNRAWVSCGTEEKMNKTELQEWDVYTLSLLLHKQDDESNPLEGVKFSFYDVSDTEMQTPLLFQNLDGVYYRVDSGEDTVDVLETDANGDLKIRALDGSSYRIAEVDAPLGYQKIEPLALNVTTATDGDVVTRIQGKLVGSGLAQLETKREINDQETEAVFKLTVTDPKQGSTLLPATGGKGRILVYVGGALLLIFSFVASIISRRREEEE